MYVYKAAVLASQDNAMVTILESQTNPVGDEPFSYVKTSFCSNTFICRVRTGPGKPGKSWNFILAFSRTGRSWKKATGPGKFWKSGG